MRKTPCSAHSTCAVCGRRGRYSRPNGRRLQSAANPLNLRQDDGHPVRSLARSLRQTESKDLHLPLSHLDSAEIPAFMQSEHQADIRNCLCQASNQGTLISKLPIRLSSLPRNLGWLRKPISFCSASRRYATNSWKIADSSESASCAWKATRPAYRPPHRSHNCTM